MPTNIFQTQNLAFDYTESTVEKPVLWENHCHTQFEIILVLEGDVNIMLEGRCYRLEAEQGFLKHKWTELKVEIGTPWCPWLRL